MNSDAQIDDHGSDANPAGGCSGSNSSHPATTMIGCCDSHLPVCSQSQTPPLQPALSLLSRGASADISRSRRIVASPRRQQGSTSGEIMQCIATLHLAPSSCCSS